MTAKLQSNNKPFATCALLTLLVASNASAAPCSHRTEIHNDSNITLRFVELKSAVTGGGIYKSQWKGTKNIAAGATATINWTSDYACTDSLGDPNTWNVKLIRKNGNKHVCGGLGQSEPVSVDTPNLCFAN